MTPCPKCGTLSDGKFCPTCGAQVVAAQPAPAYQPPQTPPPVYPHQPPQTPPPVYPHQAPSPFPPQQYPGIQYTPAPPPPKKGGALKWVLGIIGGLIGLFVLLIALASFLPDADTPTSNDRVSSAVGEVTVTDKVNPETQEPTGAALKTVPAATPQIYAAAPVNLKKGQRLSAQWFVNGTHVPAFDGEVTADRDLEGIYASFYIKQKSGTPFTKGTYRVVIYVDGNAAGRAEFTVN